MLSRKIMFLLLALLCSNTSIAADISDAEAMELGYSISAINAALQHPEAPGTMHAITDLGHDQRYYVMVRG